MSSLRHTPLGALLRRQRVEHELDAELHFHLEMEIEKNLRAGLAPEEARRAALRAFGGVDRVKEQVRDAWGLRVVDTLRQDVRTGLRSLRRNPLFALVVMLTMAMGIGANAAIFSVVNGVILRPLPYDGGDRLVVLRQQQPRAGVDDMGFSYKEIVDVRRESRALAGLVEYHSMFFILLNRAEPERVSTGVVSWDFFGVLGVEPLHGRAFVPDDEQPGSPAVLVLGHGYWQRSFGGDPRIVGQVFQMNDRPHTIVGVLPDVPQYPDQNDVYMPAVACPFRGQPQVVQSRTGRMLGAIGRLRPGVTRAEAEADLQAIAAQLQERHPEAYPKERGYQISVTPLDEELTRAFRPTLAVLLGSVGFVLLMVCASVANLMLARLVRRERELAIRTALGAGRGRLFRQLITESTLLAVAGGLLGLVLAWVGLDLLVGFAGRFTIRAGEISIDGRVLLFTLGLSLATGVVFGSVPALAAPREATRGLRDGGGRATGGRQRVRNALVVAQVAISFVLLIGAGLTLRSVMKLEAIDPGFRTDNVLAMRVALNFTKYRSAAQRGDFYERLLERLAADPAVVAAAGAGTYPLNEIGAFTSGVIVEERPVPRGSPPHRADIHVASGEYFRAIGVPVLHGRAFTNRDRAGAPRVAIVNRSMARRHWPDRDPIGRRLSPDGGTWLTIVGVVADARQRLDLPPADEVYLPLLQAPPVETRFLVRAPGDPRAVERRVREAVFAIDPRQPVDGFRTLEEARGQAIAPRRLTALLLAGFGCLAIVITAVGIGGVIALSVNQRTREFGIRMALGARRAQLLATVIGQGLALTLIGLAIGVLGARSLARLMTGLLFGVAPTDAFTFAAVACVLLLVAALACLIPARRASTVDPIVALRAF
jgi:predicted permease